MKREFKPGNLLYPVPAVLVSVADREGNDNLFTVAWTGTVCTNPPMVSVSVRPERYSYHMLRETGEFVINLTTEAMAWATDFCGVRSGRDTDKWRETGLTRERARKVAAPLVAESPVNLECRVTEVRELGSHHMFLAEVVAVDVSEAYFDGKDAFRLSAAKPLAYSHGRYYGLGAELGSFGYSVRKGKQERAREEEQKGRGQRARAAESAQDTGTLEAAAGKRKEKCVKGAADRQKGKRVKGAAGMLKKKGARAAAGAAGKRGESGKAVKIRRKRDRG